MESVYEEELLQSMSRTKLNKKYRRINKETMALLLDNYYDFSIVAWFNIDWSSFIHILVHCRLTLLRLGRGSHFHSETYWRFITFSKTAPDNCVNAKNGVRRKVLHFSFCITIILLTGIDFVHGIFKMIKCPFYNIVCLPFCFLSILTYKIK